METIRRPSQLPLANKGSIRASRVRHLAYLALLGLVFLLSASPREASAQASGSNPPGVPLPPQSLSFENSWMVYTPAMQLAMCNWFRNWFQSEDEDQMTPCYLSQNANSPGYAEIIVPVPGQLYMYVSMFEINQPLPFYGDWAQTPYQAGQVFFSYQFEFPDYGFDPGLNAGDGGNCDGGEGSNDGSDGSGAGGNASSSQSSCPDTKGAPMAGDPINFATGNRYLQEDDYLGTPWLTFRRFYNSLTGLLSSTAMGTNWRNSFDRSLSISGSPASTIVLVRPDGRTETFTKSNNVWVPNAGITDTLSEIDNPQGTATSYVVFISALRHYEAYNVVVDAAGNPSGQLETVTDETGQGITLTYSTSLTMPSVAPQPNLLITVTDPQGRQLNFTYNAGGQLSQVSLPDGGTLSYAYDTTTNFSNLLSVQYPDGTSRQYVYNESALTGGVNRPGFVGGSQS